MRSSLHLICGPFRRSVALFAALLSHTFAAHAQVAPSSILQPSGAAFDAAGNLYFADASRNQVFESTLAGSLVLIAGNGIQGFAGDGASATAAELNQPQSIAIDSSGTLYIADTGNQRIRSISSGIIATFAGTGIAGFAGDHGLANAAALHTPTALAVDSSGTLYIADTGNQRIRSISSGIITTLAGNGSQGFSGDNGPAASAQLDSPSGIAVAPDGRIFLSDTHNDRIRLISSGIITTVAGTGSRGFTGDNGPAIAARLALPRGLTYTSAGNLLFADSNNQRIRSISSGIITTIAGNGVQGSASDASPGSATSIDTPRSVAMSTFGSPTFSDAPSHTLRELVAAANLYRPAGLSTPPRTSIVTLTIPMTSYGQTAATVTVSGVAGTPQGTIQLLQGSSVAATAQLAAGSASIPLLTLPTGSYTFTAAYAGDGINPAANSLPATLTIGQALATATANAVTTTWSQSIPPLTGTLSGILPKDAANVSVTFSTPATPLSLPGNYPIAATLTGSASTQYTLVLAPNSGLLRILQAPTITAVQPLAQSSYAGLPLLLSATVTPGPPTPKSPSGNVTFFDSSIPIATVPVSAGVSVAVYTSPVAGAHSITASYSGDSYFSPSTSLAVTTSVGVMPDFTLSNSGGSSQTVTAGSIASFNLAVSSQSVPFTGVVSFSVSGLPTNATASFTPTQVVPGGASVPVVLTIQTPATKVMLTPSPLFHRREVLYAIVFLPCLLSACTRRRRHWQRSISLGLLTVILLSGCGDRITPDGALNATSSNLVVTATSTNLAGAIVSHSVRLVLQVD